jgi:hypothetical protein
VREFIVRCQERGTPVVLLVIPSKVEVDVGRAGVFTRGVSEVLAAARSDGAMVVDLIEPLRETGPEHVYFARDEHINAAGHELVGRVLAQAVKDVVR